MVSPLGVAVCRCKAGFFPKPDTITGCGPQCSSDEECSNSQNCAAGRCVNICDDGICGINALCEPRNRRAICRCPSGYSGDPFTRCNIQQQSTGNWNLKHIKGSYEHELVWWQINVSFPDRAVAAVAATVSAIRSVPTGKRSWTETAEVVRSAVALSPALRLLLLLSVDHHHSVDRHPSETILAPASVVDPTPTAWLAASELLAFADPATRAIHTLDAVAQNVSVRKQRKIMVDISHWINSRGWWQIYFFCRTVKQTRK